MRERLNNDKSKKAAGKPVIELGDTAPDLLAQAIVDVAEAAKRLNGSRLSARAVHLLIRDKCNVPLVTISKVLNAAADLGSYVKR